MKRFIPLIIAVLFLNCIEANCQNYDDAGEYMSYISLQQHNINKKFMSYASASAHGKKARKVENLRTKLLDEVQESRMNISGMPSYKGDKSYRDSAVSFMKLYFNVLNEDYSKIINMEDIAEQSYDAMEAYMLAKEQVDIKLEEGNEKLRNAQSAFAAKNNIIITEGKSELGDMMKQVHEMNQYYKVLYLIFFKPFKQEIYLLEAMNKENITGIEQNKNSLQKYAQEGIDKLASIKGFQGDNTLVQQCRKVLDFYLKEADKMSSVSDFYLTKERFDGIKKEYEKKSQPTKEDRDAYNKGVNDINKASQAFNSSVNSLNQMRNDILDNWNNTVNAFFANHTPRYK